jgi:hypothetical protein
MSLSPEPPAFASRIIALARRLGLGGKPARELLQGAGRLRLPFVALQPPSRSIWWRSGAPLYRLPELPRGALSGPVQEDKADAHKMLVRIVEQRRKPAAPLDLREINGLGSIPGIPAYSSLEEFSGSSHCRQIRIISYRDFLRTLELALPKLANGAPVPLYEASWRGEQLFWGGEQHNAELACAIVYARRRGLEMNLQAEITSYRISLPGLNALEQRFHMLAMPAEAWSDPAFMALLLDNQLPYSRASLMGAHNAADCLLLPKQHELANAFGDGLRRAGAPDVVGYLRKLS